jgi:branched-chain amino acid transport system permease protein
MSRNQWLAAGAGAVAALYLPYTLNNYQVYVANVAMIFALLAIGLCLSLGISGQINLAQIAFFGVGAYTSAVLTTHYGVGYWLAGAAGIVAASLIALLVGVPALRVQSHYLAIVTLGLALAFLNFVSNTDLTGRAEGMLGLPSPTFFGIDLSDKYLHYYLELVVLAGGLAFALFVVRTRLGRRLQAMRDDHLAAASVGCAVPVLRIAAFALGGVFGGLAGVLYTGLVGYIGKDTFSVSNMFLLLAMVIIGGRQSLIGSVVGAVALVIGKQALAEFSTQANLAYGLLVVLAVLFAPAGLAGVPTQVRQIWHRLRGDDAGVAVGGVRRYVRTSTADAVGPVADAQPALEIRGIGKRFKGLVALEKVHMSVRQGEIRGIVGPNGSGKTTLFNVISGLYVPSSGTVRIFSTDMTGASPARLSLSGVARTFQNVRLFRELSVRDNVLVALDRTRTRWAWRYLLAPVRVWLAERDLRRQADAILTRYGLDDVADAAPASLPYGTQRRVEIARAMASAPRLLLLDEPAAGLNGGEVVQLGDIIRDIRASGVTVVLIEHNMGLVMSLCDQVTVLASGGVLADDVPAVVARDAEVIKAYLGDSGVIEVPFEVEAAQ